MSTNTKAKKGIQDRYLDLILEWPLASIKNDGQLVKAQKVLDTLLTKGPLDRGEVMYLEALTDLVAIYEEANVVIPAVSDSELLCHLMEAKGVNQIKVAIGTGIAKSTVSNIANGKRPISRSHVVKLAAFFGVPASTFAPR